MPPLDPIRTTPRTRPLITAALRFGELLTRIARRALIRFYRGRPVPLKVVRGLRHALPRKISLMPPIEELRADGRSLNHPWLSSELADQELGLWTLGPRTLNFLQDQIARLRPQAVIELGSGISTICLARYMKDIHGSTDRSLVISIEQSEQHAMETSDTLKRLGLDDSVRVINRPLIQQTVNGRSEHCYDLSGLDSVLGDVQPELIVIDGPAGPGTIRTATLPLLMRFVRKADFVLDDAMREEELAIASRWSRLKGVHIEGVIPWETGLLLGRIG